MTGSATATTHALIEFITPLVTPLGYEIVHLEIHTPRQKILRIFIDRADPSAGPIGVEDCVKVSHALNEPLDKMSEIDALFHGTYELEVSSPGVDRPLRQVKDFERFAGREARIHVFRPLTAGELENSDYQKRNPKQKNFLGILKGVRNEKLRLEITSSAKTTNSEEAVMIPLPLISKANLEPKFELKE